MLSPKELIAREERARQGSLSPPPSLSSSTSPLSLSAPPPPAPVSSPAAGDASSPAPSSGRRFAFFSRGSSKTSSPLPPLPPAAPPAPATPASSPAPPARKQEAEQEEEDDSEEDERRNDDSDSEEGASNHDDSDSEDDFSNPSFSPSVTANKSMDTGKQGFLWREVDTELSSTFMETHQKVWVAIMQHRLLFSRPVDKNTTAAQYLAHAPRTPCLGYLSLTPNTQFKVKHTGSQASSRFPIYLKDEETSVTLCAESESERQAWLNTLRESILGQASLSLSHCPLFFPDFASDSTNFSANAAPSVNKQTAEFPTKSGYLKKTSAQQSSSLLKSSRKRWFRLEGGELRYYEDEDVRPSKLKDTLDLHGAKLSFHSSLSSASGDSKRSSTNVDKEREKEKDSKDDRSFTLSLQNGRVLRLQASTAALCNEWRAALTETLSLLRSGAASAQSVRARRVNMCERRDAAQRQRLVAAEEERLRKEREKRSFFGGGSSSSSSSAAASLSPSSNAAAAASATERERFRAPAVTAMLRDTLQRHFLVKNALLRDLDLPDLAQGTETGSAVSDNAVNEALAPLLALMHTRIAVPGEVILWQGSSGDEFFVLERGQCEVLKDDARVAFLSAGKAFGDMALLSQASRQATVRATQSCRLWTLSRHDFRSVVAQQESRKLQERVSFLRDISLFTSLLDTSLVKLAEVMQKRVFKEGERIIKQGDAGDAFFMIVSGRVSVTQTTGLIGSTTTELVRLGPGKHFGELALLEDSPRKASVTALTNNTTCWTVDRNNFLSLFGSMSRAVNESVGVKMLKQVKLLESLSDRQLVEIAKRLTQQTFNEGDVIIRQGEQGDTFYMLSQGSVSVQVNHIQVAVLEKNAFFGEMALLSNEKRSATVLALSDDTQCLCLSRADFTALLGPLDALIQAESKKRERALRERERRASVGGAVMSSLRHLSISLSGAASAGAGGKGGAEEDKRKSRRASTMHSALFNDTSAMFSLEDIEILQRIGQGTFSRVYLTQHRLTQKHYALKSLCKEHLFTTDTERTVHTEKEIMLILADSMFTPALYATLQDPKSVHFVMPYYPGGDLFTLLYGNANSSSASPSPVKSGGKVNRFSLGSTKAGGIPPNQAAFYAGNVFAALVYMHEQGVVYRDVKPENIMLDSSGYVKLVDYGSAVCLSLDERTSTLCGSAEYLAPEMLLCQGYNSAVDLWSLGVLLCELLTRESPFAHSNLAIVFQNILESRDTVPTFLSTAPHNAIPQSAKTMILGLLHFIPSTRLGMLCEGLSDVWKSPFFVENGVSHESVWGKMLPAPFIPPSEEDAAQLAHSSDPLTWLSQWDERERETDDDAVPKYTGFFDYSDF